MARLEKVDATITGVSALLMHRYPLEPVEAIEKMSKEDQAELAAYRRPGGGLYLPAIALQRALIAGAVYSKGKGRATLQKPLAACLLVSPEYIQLGTQEYEIDSRPVVIPATKGRIVRHRPRVNEWSIAVSFEFDSTLITTVQMRQIVDDTGSRVGVLDFRPERKGPFGRFRVDNWVIK